MKLSRFLILCLFGSFAYGKILKPLIYELPNLGFKIGENGENVAQNKNAFEGLNENSNSWRAYGLVEGLERIQIEAAVDTICLFCNWGANPIDLRECLLEIAAAESLMGTAKDTTTESGAGIWQFDKGTFNDIKKWIANKHATEFLLLTSTPINEVSYYDLCKYPLIACFFARSFVYVRYPKIAETTEGRAEQWKKHYNTYKGKGTVAGYIEKARLV